MIYNYLPGVSVVTVDGGLAARRTPTSKSVLILGTSGQGPANTSYQVVDRAAASSAFGNAGTLTQAMEEAAVYSDNVYLFRIGTSPATLAGVGAVSGGGAAGFSVSLGQVSADASTRYKIWYAAGVMYLWLDGNLVYANDSGAGVVVDTADSSVTGVATAGLTIGNQTTTAKTLAGALTLSDAALLAGSGASTAPVFTAAVTGLGMTARQTYIALDQALDLLSNFPVQMVYSPNVVLDNPNVAFYVSTDATTAANNPATNPNALGWLKTTVDSVGNKTYHWSHETADSNGQVVSPATFSSASDRIGKDYHEVNFGFALSRFAVNQSEVLGGCLAFIGCNGPVQTKFDLPSIRDWVGFLPVSDPATGRITTPGKGLLGIPYMTGTTAAKLNALTADSSTGFRAPGFFETANGEYDGPVNTDRNSNPVDIGAYLHVVGDWAYLSNGVGTYVGSIAGIVAGFVSAQDEKSSTTNKPLVGVKQLYRAGLGQLDALTKASINMLRFKQAGDPPVMLHGMTAATAASDYTNMLRQRIKFLVVKQLFDEGDRFIGESSTDGLQLVAMKTALDARMINLQKRGYVAKYNFSISTTNADQRIGRANIEVTFMPADELVQLRATVAISRS